MQVWKLIHRALFGHLKQILPELKIFWEFGLIRFQLIMKNCRLSLMIHTIQIFKTSNLNPGFEFQQLFVSLKHVINLVLRIRDTGCHNRPAIIPQNQVRQLETQRR
jgi:hypothetical protein